MNQCEIRRGFSFWTSHEEGCPLTESNSPASAQKKCSQSKRNSVEYCGGDICAKSGMTFVLKNLLIKPGMVWEWNVEIVLTKNIASSCGSVSLGKRILFKGLEYSWSPLLLDILKKNGTLWQEETQRYLCNCGMVGCKRPTLGTSSRRGDLIAAYSFLTR